MPSTFALSWRILVCMKGFVKKQAFAAALFVFSVTAVFCLLSFLPDVPAKSPEKHYGGVVELWNVETFEGGSGSRTAWLTRQAAAFEREHKGLFVHVTALSAEQAAQKLKEGERFDVLCFSGSGENYLPLLRPINAAVRSNVEASGTVGGVQYALPLYCGIYALFARQSQISPNAAAADALGFSYTVRTGKHQYVLQPVVCGFTPYNSPLSALAAAGAVVGAAGAAFAAADAAQRPDGPGGNAGDQQAGEKAGREDGGHRRAPFTAASRPGRPGR